MIVHVRPIVAEAVRYADSNHSIRIRPYEDASARPLGPTSKCCDRGFAEACDERRAWHRGLAAEGGHWEAGPGRLERDDPLGKSSALCPRFSATPNGVESSSPGMLALRAALGYGERMQVLGLPQRGCVRPHRWTQPRWGRPSVNTCVLGTQGSSQGEQPWAGRRNTFGVGADGNVGKLRGTAPGCHRSPCGPSWHRSARRLGPRRRRNSRLW